MKFKPEERQFVADNWGKLTVSEMAQTLGRHPRSVIGYAQCAKLFEMPEAPEPLMAPAWPAWALFCDITPEESARTLKWAYGTPGEYVRRDGTLPSRLGEAARALP